MKQSKDPFEAFFNESPPESPIQTELDTDAVSENQSSNSLISLHSNSSATITNNDNKDDEQDFMDVELAKLPPIDLHKVAKMHSILSQFNDEQMERYECFRRAAFQKSKMTQLLARINGTHTISKPIMIVVSSIAKMFVGEVVETARIIMKERKESGPIRPCHLREAHRRLKLEGRAFKRTVSRLFR